MPLTIKKPPSEDEAAKLAKLVLLTDGIYPAHIRHAQEAESKRGRPMIAATFVVRDAEDNEREIPLYLNTSNAGLLVLRHTCVACDAEAKFNAGSVGPEDLAGHDVRVQLGTERKPRWPARNVILDVLPAEAAGVVTPFRAAG